MAVKDPIFTDKSLSTVSFVNLQLYYCGQGCRRIPDTLSRIYGSNVKKLDLSFNELTTLKGLETFPDLEELILDNNYLDDNLVLPVLPKLHTLSINKNCIKTVDSLLQQVKEKLSNISYISLLGNTACPNQMSNPENDDADYQRYRYFVLYNLPNLKFLDAQVVSIQERNVAKSRGRFMNIISPSEILDGHIELGVDSLNVRPKYTPLPKALRNPDDYKGAYGKCRYRYSGKHSEGNRFISNNDL